jgi:hypothetical protein
LIYCDKRTKKKILSPSGYHLYLASCTLVVPLLSYVFLLLTKKHRLVNKPAPTESLQDIQCCGKEYELLTNSRPWVRQTLPEHCVERIQCTGSPPPSSSHHHDRTRTLVSWTPRHIVTPLTCRTSNKISRTIKSSPIKFTREDTSRTPLLVFFPVKPRPHYMVSGRVERGKPDERETVGSLDQHKSSFVGWESSAYR